MGSKNLRRRINIGGRHLYVECAGKGKPTILFESGLGDGCSAWDSVWKQLSSITSVCRYDRAGIGKSDPAQLPRTSREVVADLHTLVNKLELAHPLVIVAHSFGCIHARLFTQEYPNKVAALVLLDSSLPDLGERILELLPAERSGESEGLTNYREALRHPKIVEEIEGLIANDCYAQVRSHKSYGDIPIITIVSGSLVFSSNESWWPPDLSGTLAADFTNIYRELRADITKLSIRGKEVFLQDSGHYIQKDKPDRVVDTILQVIKDI